MSTPTLAPVAAAQRHTLLVRVTHWVTVAAFFALLVTGGEIIISHPRFYWGETGNSGTTPLFKIPIPASRGSVPTGYDYQLPDANGWGRYLHFEAAWALVLTGLIYVVASLFNAHFRNHLLPPRGERNWRAVRAVLQRYLRRAPSDGRNDHSYNVVQRVSYLAVIFGLFPLVIWTGLALSPAVDSALPATVNLLGGRQSARTLHFFVTDLLVIFLVVHVTMIALAGFWKRTAAMFTGRADSATKGMERR